MRLSPLLALLASVSITTVASAADLTIASDSAPAAVPASPAPTSTTSDGANAALHDRSKTSIGGSLYLMSGAAIDDYGRGGLLVRPAMELYASIGLGDVSLLVGGPILAVEVSEFGDRSGIAFPALLTFGMRDDDWLVALAGGASLGLDNTYSRSIW